MKERYNRPVTLSLLLGAIFGLLLTVPGCDNLDKKETVIIEKKPYDGLIVAMGDSLTAGLGVSPGDSYPALLEQELGRIGLNYQVRNGGVSGETSSGALSRIDWIIKMGPDLVILETGANDGLRGIEPGLVQKNIDEIIKTLLEHDIKVVLAGMQMVSNMGPDYLARFNRLYPDLSATYPITLVPFFLEGVAMQADLNQADGIHPNERGYQVIVKNILPYVEEALASKELPGQ